MGGNRAWYFFFLIATPVISESIQYTAHAPLSEQDIAVRLGFEPVCINQLCGSQEDCCAGAVCVAHRSSKIGICARPLAQPEGKACLTTARGEPHCRQDLECKSIHKDFHPLGICVNPNGILLKKKYFEPCSHTIECDTHQQLCCRAQMSPGRTTHRKICSYFEDPLEQCIF